MSIFVTGCPNDSNSNKEVSKNQPFQAQSSIATTTLNSDHSALTTDKNRQPVNTLSCHNATISEVYQTKNPSIKRQVLGCGNIIKVLKDDNEGSRHQKLLVQLDDYPTITVLIAHNIDIAPRINNMQVNSPIRFYGEYIYNDKGGVIHWTHKDLAGRHQDGWLEYQGQKYL